MKSDEIRSVEAQCKADVLWVINVASDRSSVLNHVYNGGCIGEFVAAINACHPRHVQRWDDEACVKATAALRECFGGNHEWFRHQFILRLDEALDQDLTPSPEQVKKEEESVFRWWTGMRRN